jgi:Hint module
VWSGRVQPPAPTAPVQVPQPPPVQRPVTSPTLLAPTVSMPTAEPPTSSSCFSSNNLVETRDRGRITIDELQIGEYIQAGNDDYTQVYGFSHIHHNAETTFLQLFFEENDSFHAANVPLEITSKDLVFVECKNHQVVAVPASDIMVGDRMKPDGKRVNAIHNIT